MEALHTTAKAKQHNKKLEIKLMIILASGGYVATQGKPNQTRPAVPASEVTIFFSLHQLFDNSVQHQSNTKLFSVTNDVYLY